MKIKLRLVENEEKFSKKNINQHTEDVDFAFYVYTLFYKKLLENVKEKNEFEIKMLKKHKYEDYDSQIEEWNMLQDVKKVINDTSNSLEKLMKEYETEDEGEIEKLYNKIKKENESVLGSYGVTLDRKDVKSKTNDKFLTKNKNSLKHKIAPGVIGSGGPELYKYDKDKTERDLEKDDWGEYEGSFTPDDWSDWDDDIEIDAPSSWDEPDDDEVRIGEPEWSTLEREKQKEKNRQARNIFSGDSGRNSQKKTVKLVTDKIKQKRQQAKDRANKNRGSKADPVIKQTRKKH